MIPKNAFLVGSLAILIIGQFFYVDSLNAKITNLESQVERLTKKEKYFSSDDYDDRLTKLEKLVEALDFDCNKRIGELEYNADDMNSNFNDRFDALERRIFDVEWDLDDIKNLLHL